MKTGDLAYWDTFAGAIPCKVTAITGKSGVCGTDQSVTFELTEDRGAYKKGEVHTEFGHWVFPRGCLRLSKYTSTILPHLVECDPS